jgi:hypothetical protein
MDRRRHEVRVRRVHRGALNVRFHHCVDGRPRNRFDVSEQLFLLRGNQLLPPLEHMNLPPPCEVCASLIEPG